MTVLVTFSGKIGDCLWSLSAARALAATGETVDFAMMPAYGAVAPLIRRQPYIRDVLLPKPWIPLHDNCGAQPGIPPVTFDGYDRIYHLTYRTRPTEPLILYGVREVGLPLPEPPLPFLMMETLPSRVEAPVVAYAFNQTLIDQKLALVKHLEAALPDCRFLDVGRLPFEQAATAIKHALFFVGCRSANYVVAHGVAQRILTYEPEPGRREMIFSCPFGREVMPPVARLDLFVAQARQWRHDATH